jgi:alpha-glucosidase
LFVLYALACQAPQQQAPEATPDATQEQADVPLAPLDADMAPEVQPPDAAQPELDAQAEIADLDAAWSDVPADVTPACMPAIALAASPTQACGVLPVAPTWLQPGADGESWTVDCGVFDLQLTPLTAGIRLRYLAKNGPQPWPTGAMLAPQKPSAIGVGQTCDGAVLCTDALALHVDPQCRVFAVDAAGTQLLADPSNGAFAVTPAGPRLTRQTPPNERFYGLGGKTGPLDRRGRKLVLRTTDAYNAALGGYDPNGDPLYQAVPWLLLKRGATTWGVLTDDAFQQTYDLAASATDTWSVTAAGGVLDQYLVPGPAPGQVLQHYTQLTGQPFLPPRWALGYHQSRWGYKDAATFVALAQKFRDLQMPCDSLWFDIQKMQGFRSFTWDPLAFSDPKALLQTLHDQHFHAVAIVDPGLKADPQWPPYAAGVTAQMFLPAGSATPYLGTVWPGLAAFPDFTNPAVRDWWANALVPLETTLGIDALWIDMNEPSDFNPTGSVPDTLAVNGDGQTATMAAAHNVFALREVEATFNGLQAAYPERRPFVLTRAGYAGIQRYAAAWTGDAPSTAETLAGTLPMLLGLGLSGEPLVGSDVGGYSGSSDPALYARWFALGSISPFLRGHAEKSAPNQEPWQFGQEVQDIARDLLNARYRLLPYLESLAWQAHTHGTPILRPLWFEFPGDVALETIGDEAMLGPFILIAPHLSPTNLTRTVAFPAGRWVQATSGAVVIGPTMLDVTGPLADLPMWLRQGAIVPRGPLKQWATQDAIGPLDIDLVPSSDPSQFQLIQDAGEGAPDAPRRLVLLERLTDAKGTRFTAQIQPGSNWTPPLQAWRIRLWPLVASPTSVTVNSKLLAPDLWTWDGNEQSVIVTVQPPEAQTPPGALQVVFAYDKPQLASAPTIDVPLTVQVPADTPAGSTIYVAHSGNNWQQQALKWTGKPGEASGLVTVPRGQWFEYKYTRGGWNSVEKYPGCVEAKNRYAFGAVHTASLDVAGKQDAVWAWADVCK